jgi:hypothetical protein
MKVLFGLLALTLFSAQAEARDSTWLLCQNSSFVLNVHEHRAGMDSRESSLTLIYGAHVLEGALVDTDDGVVGLTTRSVRNTSYRGRIALDFAKKTALVRGELSLNGAKFNISERLACRELNGKL